MTTAATPNRWWHGQYYAAGTYLGHRKPPRIVASPHASGIRFLPLREWLCEPQNCCERVNRLFRCCIGYQPLSQIGNLRKMRQEIGKSSSDQFAAPISSPLVLRDRYQEFLAWQQRLLLGIFSLEEGMIGGLSCRKGLLEYIPQSLQMVVHCFCLPFFICHSRFSIGQTYAMGPLVTPITELLEEYNRISGALGIFLGKKLKIGRPIDLFGKEITIMAQLIPADNYPLWDSKHGLPRSCNAPLKDSIRISLYDQDARLASMDLERVLDLQKAKLTVGYSIHREGDLDASLRNILQRIVAEIEASDNGLVPDQPLLYAPNEILPPLEIVAV